MKIVLLGAGQIGRSILRAFRTDEQAEITVVDTDPSAFEEFRRQYLQVNTVIGNACHPNVLELAGVEDAEVLLAVTGSDEVNLLACQIFRYMFRGLSMRIARIRADTYVESGLLEVPQFTPIQIINPEQAVTEQFVRLIDFQGASEIIDFCPPIDESVAHSTPASDTKPSLAQLVAVKISDRENVGIASRVASVKLVGKSLTEIQEDITPAEAKVIGVRPIDNPDDISSDELPLLYQQHTNYQIREGDELYVLTRTNHTQTFLKNLGFAPIKAKRVLIAGGGHVGKRLALSLANTKEVQTVSLVELNPRRIDILEKELAGEGVQFYQGDITQGKFLQDNGLDQHDVFCAVTNDDEVNVMCSLVAKSLDMDFVLTLIKKEEYFDVVGHTAIDVAVSPQESTGSAISQLVYAINTEHRLHSVRGEESIAMEVHLTSGTRSIDVGKPYEDIKLPKRTLLLAVVRKNEVFLDHSGLVVERGDRVILFVADITRLSQVRRYFELRPEQT